MSRQPKKSIKLALQGGGSHGAFTWGVIDQLLEDERLHIGAVSGTSAGAMNAVLLAHGLLEGGRDGARAALSAFWQALGRTLPGRIGLEIRATIQGGLRILDKIEAAGYDVFRRRPVLKALDWPLLLLRAL